MTAAAWMGFNIHAFALANLEDAIAQLGVTPEVRAGIDRWLDAYSEYLNP